MDDIKDNDGQTSQRDPKTGQFRPGNTLGGRRKGHTNIYSRKSLQKLNELGIDPISELVAQYDAAIESQNDELQFKIMNKLIDYGYSKQASQVETKIEGAIPIMNVSLMSTESDD